MTTAPPPRLIRRPVGQEPPMGQEPPVVPVAAGAGHPQPIGSRPLPSGGGGLAVNPALFQAGFPLGVAQQVPEQPPVSPPPGAFEQALRGVARTLAAPEAAVGNLALRGIGAAQQTFSQALNVSPFGGRLSPEEMQHYGDPSNVLLAGAAPGVLPAEYTAAVNAPFSAALRGIQAAPQAAARAAVQVPVRTVQEAGLRLAGVEPIAGAAQEPLDTLASFEKAIKRAQGVAKNAQETGMTQSTVNAIQDEIQGLRELRRGHIQGALSPEDFARYEQLQSHLDELQAIQESRVGGGSNKAPNFGSPERAAYDELRTQRRLNEGFNYPSSASRQAAERRDLLETRRQIADLEQQVDAAPVAAAAPRAAPTLAGGQIQASMGIGERPQQGTLLGEFQGKEAPSVPLIDQERIAAQQARAAEVARGQGEFPITQGAGEIWGTLPVPERVQIATDNDLPGVTGSKGWGAMTEAEQKAVARDLQEIGRHPLSPKSAEAPVATAPAPRATLERGAGAPPAQRLPPATERPPAPPTSPAAGQAPPPEPAAAVPAQLALPPSRVLQVHPGSAVVVPEQPQMGEMLRSAIPLGPKQARYPGEPIALGPASPPAGDGLPPPPGLLGNGPTMAPRDPGSQWIPSVRSNDDILGMAYRDDWVRRVADWASGGKLPAGKVLQVVGLPERNVFKESEVLRASIMADWDSNSTGVVARLKSLGDSGKLFEVDKEGRALLGGDRIALSDVLQYPDRFPNLSGAQRSFIATIHRIEDEKLARLTEEGIDVPTLSFEEGGHYVGQRVLGRLDSQGNLELAGGGAGARRVGAKMGSEKPRTFIESTEEAIAAGYRYMKPEDVLQANLQAAGRRIADNRFSNFILDQVPYRTGAAEPELYTARDFAGDKVQKAQVFRNVVERAFRGETPPAATLKAVASRFPAETAQLRQAIGDKTALRELRPTAKALVTDSRVLLRDAQQALSRAQSIARAPKLGERMVQAPAFAGKIFNEKDADAINKAMGLAPLPKWGSVAQGVAWLNAPFRMLTTTFDIGVSGIQLLMTAFKNPIVWGKATGRGLEALVSGDRYQQFLATHAETISRWSPHGAIFTPSEFTESVRPGGLVSKIPGVRAVAKPFARYFEGILNAAEVYGLESRGPARAISDVDKADWAAHWNVMTGRSDPSRRGISQAQQYAESAVLFAPRFRRAAYTLMTDVAKGGIRGDQAREALTKMMLGGTLAYIGLAKALGQEPKLDPRDRGAWMTFEIGGQRVGLGSAYVITLRMLGQVAEALATGKPETIPSDAARYAKGLAAPLPGMVLDIAYRPNYQRDGLQRTLDLTKRVVANNLVPQWAGALLDSKATTWQSKGVGAAAQSLSLRSYPVSNSAKKSKNEPAPAPSRGGPRRIRQPVGVP